MMRFFIAEFTAHNSLEILRYHQAKLTRKKSVPLENIQFYFKEDRINVQFQKQVKSSSRAVKPDIVNFNKVFSSIYRIKGSFVKKGLANALGAVIDKILSKKGYPNQVRISISSEINILQTPEIKPSRSPGKKALLIILPDEIVFALGYDLRKYFMNSDVNLVAVVSESYLKYLGTVYFCIQNARFVNEQSSFTIFLIDTENSVNRIQGFFKDGWFEVAAFSSFSLDEFFNRLSRSEFEPDFTVLLRGLESQADLSRFEKSIKEQFNIFENVNFTEIYQSGLEFYAKFLEQPAKIPNIRMPVYPDYAIKLLDFRYRPLFSNENMLRANQFQTFENQMKLEKCLCGFFPLTHAAEMPLLWADEITLPEEGFFTLITQQNNSPNQPWLTVSLTDQAGFTRDLARFQIPKFIY